MDIYLTFMLQVTTSEFDALGMQCSGFGGEIPKTNGAEMEMTLTGSGEEFDKANCKERPSKERPSMYTPLHVLFNQFGRVCTRFNKRIQGSNFQRYFVQKLVSSIRGISWQLMYLDSTLFPGIYWAEATHDKNAILGCCPISCYRNASSPDGYASSIQISRCLATHSSSSCSTDHNYIAFRYDLEANRAGSNTDSRLIHQHGFRVSRSSHTGLELKGGNDANLQGSVDSSQAAMNLAAASQYVGFDLFLTFTCSQGTHPGIRHLFDYKESLNWTASIPRWEYLSSNHKWEYRQAFEMAYMSVVNRCWAEVRKILLDFITHSTSTSLGRVVPVFFRDEYQEENGKNSLILPIDNNELMCTVPDAACPLS